MKRQLLWVIVAALIGGATMLTSCSKDDDENVVETLTPKTLAGNWVNDYAEDGTDGEATWSRVVENYSFNDDGMSWWGYVHCRQQATFEECDHPGYELMTCPYCHSFDGGL